MQLDFANLLRQSRIASLAPELRPPASPIYGQKPFQIYPTCQVITAPKQHLCRNDWGIKSALPSLKTSFIDIAEFDTLELQPRFRVANDKVMFLRRSREMGLAINDVDPSGPSDSVDSIGYRNPCYSSTSNRRGPWLGHMSKKTFENYCKKLKSQRKDYTDYLEEKAAAALIEESPYPLPEDTPKEQGKPPKVKMQPSHVLFDQSLTVPSNAPIAQTKVGNNVQDRQSVFEFLEIPESKPRRTHGSGGLVYAGAGILPQPLIFGRMLTSVGTRFTVAIGGLVGFGDSLIRSSTAHKLVVMYCFFDDVGRLHIKVDQQERRISESKRGAGNRALSVNPSPSPLLESRVASPTKQTTEGFTPPMTLAKLVNVLRNRRPLVRT